MVVPQIPGSHDKTLDLCFWLGVIKERTPIPAPLPPRAFRFLDKPSSGQALPLNFVPIGAIGNAHWPFGKHTRQFGGECYQSQSHELGSLCLQLPIRLEFELKPYQPEFYQTS